MIIIDRPGSVEPAPAVGTEPGRGLIRVTGGRELSARMIEVQGAPQAAVVLLAAAAATRRNVTVDCVPATAGVRSMRGLLEACGWTVAGPGPRVRVSAEHLSVQYPDADLSGAGMWAGSHYLAPAMLGAFGRAELPRPAARQAPVSGLCLDLVLKVFEHFGDSPLEHGSGFLVTAGNAPPAVEIALPNPARPATITALLRAASLGASTVTVHNADLSAPVMALFAALVGSGMGGTLSPETGTVTLGPGRRTDQRAWQVPGDAIEAGILACAVLAAAGRGMVTGFDARELMAFSRVLGEGGLYVEPDGDRVHVRTLTRYRDRPWAGIRARTGHGPQALSSALEPALMALALSVPGSHKLEDHTAPARHAATLALLEAMGARIIATTPVHASFTGPQPLHAARLHAPDPHTGAAAIIAALAARGTTEISGLDQVRSRYPQLPAQLARLGAEIEVLEA